MLQKSDIETKIKKSLSGFLKTDPSKIKGNSLLREELGLDSMDTIELVFELEDNFNIQISDDDLMGFKTMDNVVEYVAKKVDENK
jgi:acyl carrier protein